MFFDSDVSHGPVIHQVSKHITKPYVRLISHDRMTLLAEVSVAIVDTVGPRRGKYHLRESSPIYYASGTKRRPSSGNRGCTVISWPNRYNARSPRDVR